MAVVIWRNGKPKKIEAEELQQYLAQGWHTTGKQAKPQPTKAMEHIGRLDFPEDATELEKQQIVLGKMHIRV